MKKIIFASALITFLASFNNPQLKSSKSQSSGQFLAAVLVTPDEFTQLTSEYNPDNAGSTKGGMIGKTELLNFVNFIPNSQDFVRFRFAVDATSGKTTLMLRGDKSLLKNTQYIRNGGSPEAFCPLMCDAPTSATKITMTITAEDFNNQSAAYEKSYAASTQGGRIDKAALVAIVNSLPTEAKAVKFRFCTDEATGKTSVIFCGGNVGQMDNTTLYYRNGLNADAFCPLMCD